MIRERIITIVLVVAMLLMTIVPANAETFLSENFASGSSNWTFSDNSKISLADYAGSKMLYINGVGHSKTLIATAGQLKGNISFECDFAIVSDGGYIGWYVFYTPAQDYLLQLYPSGELKFLKRTKANGNAYAELASTSAGISRQDVHKMKITYVDGTLTAYVDGANKLQATDTEIKSGAVGFRSLSGDAYFGNISVTDGTGGSSVVPSTPSAPSTSSTQPATQSGALYSENFDGGMRGFTVEKNPTSFTGENYGGSGKLKFSDLKNNLDAGIAVTGDIAWTDYTFNMSLTPSELRYMGALFRYQNTDNHYLLQFYGNGSVKLLKKVNGSLYTTVATSNYKLKKGETYKVSITADGEKITANVDGNQVISAYDNSLKNGKIGFRGMYSSFYVDDVTVAPNSSKDDKAETPAESNSAAAGKNEASAETNTPKADKEEVSLSTSSDDDLGLNVIFSDKFDGGLSKWSLNSDTAAKASIKEYGGNNMLFMNGKASSKTLLASVSKQCKDISFESEFLMESAGGYVGWLIRYSGAGTYLLQYCPDGSFKFYKQIASAGKGFSQIVSENATIEPAKIYKIKIDAIGSKITAYLDGKQIISVEDSDLTSGGFGVRSLSADVCFDNIVCKSEGAANSTAETTAPTGGTNAASATESDYPEIKPGTTKEMFEQRVAELPLEISLKTPAAITGATKIFVAPNGDDNAAGTIEQPLKTLQVALNKAKTGNPADTVIYMRGGDYSVSETIKIDSALSGIKISSYNGEDVRLVGGRYIKSSSFSPVAGTPVAERFPLSSRDKIKVLDLQANGINDYGEILAGGYYLDDEVLPVELFYNDAKMTLSRWPNDGNVAIREVIDAGNAPAFEARKGTKHHDDGRGFEFKIHEERPFNWASDDDIWLYGAYSREWAVSRIKVKDINTETQSIRTVHASPYGAVQGCEFYFLNVMDELDMPGEFYIDRTNKKLYIYPLGDQSNDTITYSSLKSNMIDINNANNVVISGISLEAGMGDGISMKGVNGAYIQGVSIKNMGGNGINGSSCFDTTVLSCNLTGIARNGIFVGGNSWTLKKNNNYIQNNYLTDIGNDNDGIGIQMNGTGNVASHNSIHVLETSALRFNGCENIMEYNEFGDTMRRVEDGGSIYTFSQYLVRGNHIRYNYIHDFYGYDTAAQGGPHAIYLDNLTSDNYVYGNTLINGKAPIHHTWGREVVVANNIIAGMGRSTTSYYSIVDQEILQMAVGLSYFETPEQNRFKPFDENGQPYGDFKTLTQSIPYQSEAWVARYPRLKTLNTDEWWLPKYGYYDSNIIYDHKDIRISENRIKYGELIDTKLTKIDPFVDYKGGNYNINPKSAALAEYPNFEIPPSYEKAGIVSDGVLRTKKPSIGKIALTYPENHAAEIGVGNINLRWTKATGADFYNIEVATDPEMKNVIISKTSENNYIDINVDGLGTRYYWRVTANTRMNSINKAPSTSSVWSFTTQTAGTAVEEFIRSAEQILAEYSAADSKYKYSKENQDKLRKTIEKIRAKSVSQWSLSDVDTMREAINKFLMNAEMLTVVNDNFGAADVGKYPAGYTESARGKLTVESVDGDYAIKIVDDITDNYAVLPRSFDSVTGAVELSFRAKPMQTNCMMFLKVRQDASTDPVVISFSNSGKICVGSGFDAGTPITSYQAETWYDFKLEINSIVRSYSLYVNGEKLIDNKPFDTKFYDAFATKNYLNGIVITTGSPMEDLGTFYFDDLKIATASLPDADLALNDALNSAREELWEETLKEMGDRLVIAIGSPRAANKTGLMYLDTNSSVVPYVKNDRTLVPIRFLSERMNAKVDWDDDTKTVTIKLDGNEVKMQIDNTTFYINGAARKMDAAPEISNGRTFVPIRAAAEALGVKIDYSPLGLVSISNTDNAFATMREISVMKLASHLK